MLQRVIQVVDSHIEPGHRFDRVVYRDTPWDLSHLDAFAFKSDPGLGYEISVLVLFSCHCFSHSFRRDARERHAIPSCEVFDDGNELRVLDPTRYALSKRLLRGLVMDLPRRRISLAGERQPNFVTLESTTEDGNMLIYAVFFEIKKDHTRKRRLILRVQSAYVLDGGLTKRQTAAGRVGFETLLRATYLGKKIRG